MNPNIEKAFNFFGTQEKMAVACRVSQSAVHKWTSGKSMPSALNAKRIEKATEGLVSASELLPDIFN